ncbi:Kelch repeat-containing protein [Roseateles violae]|uniref:Galactose oxidase-like protein n=1 Tax=Roseateles violae TaxID=3058042 RepID=A0ABT8DPN8_9BURK|nr:hypothetical protein [Pelomonas sp. PFR6]MDN3920305.1 hypothetical protein [Pelomonas sp. PFR6]
MSKPNSMRRREWLGSAAALALTACGGGGSDGSEPAPAITSFGAAAASHCVGERARLTAVFAGGQGRIEPDIGPVSSGVPVETPALDRSCRYTLIVEAPGRPPLRRELDLQVGFRGRYQPLAMPFALQYHAVATAADGAIIVLGGSRGGPVMSDAIDRFDPLTRTFTRIGRLRSGRSGHTATRLADGQILVVGGQLGLNIGPITDLVDERNGAVVDGGRLQQPRNRHAAVALADGRVLLVGGAARDTVELWDPMTRQFRLVAARMRHVREYPSATLLQDGRVLIAGGLHPDGNHWFAEIFDPRSESFAPVDGVVADRRSLHQAHRLADGRVLILGGEVIDAPQRIVPLATVLQFDPNSARITPQPDLERPRSLVQGVLLPDEQVLLFGGWTNDEERATPSAAAYRSNGAEVLPAMPLGRAWHTVSRLPDGRLLILGGDDENGAPVMTAYLYE